MLYLLDANVLITANNTYYQLERVRQYWNWLVSCGNLGQLKIPREIYDEIRKGQDDLWDWLKTNRNTLLLNEEVDSHVVWSCPAFVDTLGVRREEEATMPKTHRPYAPEFRQQMVELVQSGRTPEELALEYEPSAAAIRNWVAQQERDAGRREDGLSSDERQELRQLRRENKQLRIERDILKKAAAWFARESDSIPERGSSS